MRGASANTVISAFATPGPRRCMFAATSRRNTPAVRSPVARVGIGKMLSDVSLAERAQHGIAQRVDHDVAVGVRHHPPVVRDVHATQHHVIAVAEGVNVESLPDPHLALHPFPPRIVYPRRHRQIFRSGSP